MGTPLVVTHDICCSCGEDVTPITGLLRHDDTKVCLDCAEQQSECSAATSNNKLEYAELAQFDVSYLFTDVSRCLQTVGAGIVPLLVPIIVIVCPIIEFQRDFISRVGILLTLLSIAATGTFALLLLYRMMIAQPRQYAVRTMKGELLLECGAQTYSVELRRVRWRVVHPYTRLQGPPCAAKQVIEIQANGRMILCGWSVSALRAWNLILKCAGAQRTGDEMSWKLRTTVFFVLTFVGKILGALVGALVAIAGQVEDTNETADIYSIVGAIAILCVSPIVVDIVSKRSG